MNESQSYEQFRDALSVAGTLREFHYGNGIVESANASCTFLFSRRNSSEQQSSLSIWFGEVNPQNPDLVLIWNGATWSGDGLDNLDGIELAHICISRM